MDTIPQDAPQDKPTTFIYLLRDPETQGVRYIGKSNNPARRLREHIRDHSKYRRHKDHWIGALQARGLAPLMEVIEEAPLDLWAERELFWINHYTQLGHPLTNTYFGSEGIGMMPPETRAKIGAIHKGKKLTPEAIEKRSAAIRGTKRSPETKARIAARKLGVKRPPRSEDWQLKLNDGHRGRKNTPETLARMSDSAKRRERAPFSEEARHNMRDAHRGKTHSLETREKIAASKRGKKASPEARANMSLGRKRAKAMRENPPDVSA